MAKVLFINPVVREEDVPRHVPYGIALLAAIAMNRNRHWSRSTTRTPGDSASRCCAMFLRPTSGTWWHLAE